MSADYLTIYSALAAAFIGFAGGLTISLVMERFVSRRHRELLEHDRKLRLRDDRRRLYRDFLEAAYSVVNTLNRAANWVFLDEVAVDEGFEFREEARDAAQARAGELTDQVFPQLNILQARIREIEVIGGKDAARAAYAVHSSAQDLWGAFPTALRKPVSKEEYGRLHSVAHDQIGAFVEEIRSQLALD